MNITLQYANSSRFHRSKLLPRFSGFCPQRYSRNSFIYTTSESSIRKPFVLTRSKKLGAAPFSNFPFLNFPSSSLIARWHFLRLAESTTYELFCANEFFNSRCFSSFRTLGPKQPGWGTQLYEPQPAWLPQRFPFSFSRRSETSVTIDALLANVRRHP